MDYKTEKNRALWLSSSKRYKSKKILSTGGRIILVATVYTGWLKSFESDTFLPVEESKFIRYFNISSSI